MSVRLSVCAPYSGIFSPNLITITHFHTTLLVMEYLKLLHIRKKLCLDKFKYQYNEKWCYSIVPCKSAVIAQLFKLITSAVVYTYTQNNVLTEHIILIVDDILIRL